MINLRSRGVSAKLQIKNYSGKSQKMAGLGSDRLGWAEPWLGLVRSGTSDPDPTNLVTPYRFTFKI